jgi:hypothetical protein
MRYKLFNQGRYHLIPSFFRTLMYLKKQKKEFAISFRTFGTDLDDVVYEFDKFCKGEHPCFNGRNNMPLVKMDGSKNSKDFRFKSDEQHCSIYRKSSELKETVMIQGPHPRCKDHCAVNMMEGEDVEIYKDHLEIHQTMLEILKKYGAVAVSDDYESWNSAGRDIANAKLLMVDQADYNTQHIFFDDNADEDRECIVDVRDVITGE